MSKSGNPNRKPFPRAFLVDPFERQARVHRLVREIKEAYYRRKNPAGFRHDLGALDIFLDNFGILIAEHIYAPEIPIRVTESYLGHLQKLLHYRWDNLKTTVSQKRPYWGAHFNSKTRKANAGEPRGLFRFLNDEDWSIWAGDAGGGDGYQASDNRTPLFDEDGFHLPYIRDLVAPLRMEEGAFSFQDWTYEDLFPEDYLKELSTAERSGAPKPIPVNLDGVILPPGSPPRVAAIRILHPRQATPDLPLRVGLDEKDKLIYKDVLRNQGDLGTCVSHAVCTGLDILARRTGKRRKPRFSPAWLHCASGEDGAIGRRLSDAIHVVQENLPCTEGTFPYRPERLRLWSRKNEPLWESPNMRAESGHLTNHYGRVAVKKLDLQEISVIKAYLAAGWVVVVTTMLTEEFLGHGLMEYGLPLAPLKGQEHLPGGHAWLLVGYEHSDGNAQWKYQGRFLALNSWGNRFPRQPAMGEGICSFPFAMLLTEGLEGFALKFK